jgi:hypothetical protein
LFHQYKRVSTKGYRDGRKDNSRCKLRDLFYSRCGLLFASLSTEQARAEMLAMAEVCDGAAAQQTHGTYLSEAGAPERGNQQLSRNRI